jgi:hypothetical protein
MAQLLKQILNFPFCSAAFHYYLRLFRSAQFVLSKRNNCKAENYIFLFILGLCDKLFVLLEERRITDRNVPRKFFHSSGKGRYICLNVRLSNTQ